MSAPEVTAPAAVRVQRATLPSRIGLGVGLTAVVGVILW